MIPKTISPTDLRKNLYAVVKDVATSGAQYLVTQSEGESVLICSRDEYNAIVEERQLLRDLRDAEADVKAGRMHTTAEVRAFLDGSVKRKSKKGSMRSK